MQFYSHSNSTFSYKNDSGEVAQVDDATEEQKTLLLELCSTEDEKYLNPEYSVHQLWHSAPDFDSETMDAYEYGELLEEWAKDKPLVKIFGFDDEMFMSSVGFVIPSASKYEHMGVNVILCPQCSKAPVNFFCYPNHLSSLLKAFGAAEVELLNVPARDNSSPLFLKKQELMEKLLNTVKEPKDFVICNPDALVKGTCV